MSGPESNHASQEEEKEDPLATAEYWDSRYATSDGQTATHEWLHTYSSLGSFLQKHLFEPFPPTSNPLIMHLGSGDSTIPYDLATHGYLSHLCLDFSHGVVDLMSQRSSPPGTTITWQWADIRDMPDLASSTVDVAFDKSTFDAMVHGSPWDPPKVVWENTGRYLKEVSRVLKDDGVFLLVSFRQPHFTRKLFEAPGVWDLEVEVLSDGTTSFDNFGWVLRKKRKV